MSGTEVVVDGVSKSFENGRVVALRGVSLRLDPGEFVSLVGPSGCGKSTLLNLIGALDRPDSGTISVAGKNLQDIGDPSQYRALIVGFVFQFHNLVPTLSASENVQLPMIGQGSSRAVRERKAHQLLREVGLSQRTRARPTTLSGGERQRVAIARALANGPRLLLADEPTGSLDSETSDQIISLFEGVSSSPGTTILVVTNDDGVAGRTERKLRMRDGRLLVDPIVQARPVTDAVS
ncbi:MAG: ABC transporter ATP-binding protein [Gaiellaceae bacterium]